MADLSSFGTPDAASLLFFCRNQFPSLPADPHARQLLQNIGREDASERWICTTGSKLRTTVVSCDIRIPTRDKSSIPARMYRRNQPTTFKKPLYVFFHPGGFFTGTIKSEDAVCTRIIDKLDITILHVVYRHAPDFQWPAQVHDAFDAFDWITGEGKAFLRAAGAKVEKLVVGGMSAGAMLAAAVALREIEGIEEHGMRISGLVLHIPWLVHPANWDKQLVKSPEVSSYEQCKHAPILPKAEVDFYLQQVAPDGDDRWFNVGLMDDQLAKLMPKTAIIVAGWDILRDDGLLFARKLQRNGTFVQTTVFPGLPHGFRRAEHFEASKAWDEQVWKDIKWCLSEEPGLLQLRVPLERRARWFQKPNPARDSEDTV